MNIIIFDGICNLCNGWVDFLMRRARPGRFVFLPYQSDRARELFRSKGLSSPAGTTVMLVEGEAVYERSSAVLRIFRLLGFPWSMLYAFIIIPACWRDKLYNAIARRRFRWFGRRTSCRIEKKL